MDKLQWKTAQRQVKELIPYGYNPRILSEDKKAKLKASLEKFNLAEIPAINTDNTIIAGHQRVLVLMELGRGNDLIDVRVPNRALTEEEFKEYNLRSNISVGEWDVDLILKEFDTINLEDIGLTFDSELDEMLDQEAALNDFENKFNAVPNSPEFPLVAKYNEKYNAVMIIAENITDLTFLQTVLELEKEASYKSERIGQTSVLTAKKFQELWEKKSK